MGGLRGIRFFAAAIPAPCPLCQQYVEMYRERIGKEFAEL